MTWNPYLDEWAAACGSRVRGWICCSEVGESPSAGRALSCWADTEPNRRQVRSHLTRKYAYGVPGEKALECLARYEPIVEMGSGNGYWARCLRERGIDIIAFDEMEEQWRTWFRPSVLRDIETSDGVRALESQPDPRREPVLWTRVLKGGPNVLRSYAERTLLLCWPDPWSGFDEASLRAYPGDALAFVGDPREGGTGSEAFRNELRRAWTQIDEAEVPRWHGCEDRLAVYRRSSVRES